MENIKIMRYGEVRSDRIYIIEFLERKKMEKIQYFEKINNFLELRKDEKFQIKVFRIFIGIQQIKYLLNERMNE